MISRRRLSGWFGMRPRSRRCGLDVVPAGCRRRFLRKDKDYSHDVSTRILTCRKSQLCRLRGFVRRVSRVTSISGHQGSLAPGTQRNAGHGKSGAGAGGTGASGDSTCESATICAGRGGNRTDVKLAQLRRSSPAHKATDRPHR